MANVIEKLTQLMVKLDEITKWKYTSVSRDSHQTRMTCDKNLPERVAMLVTVNPFM